MGEPKGRPDRPKSSPLSRASSGTRLACCAGLLGLVAVCPFFTGAQSQLAWSVMGVVSLVLASILFATTLRRPRRLCAPWVLVALAVLALLLLIQLVPLPVSVVGALSPRRAELAAQADAALGRAFAAPKGLRPRRREPPVTLALTLSTKTTRDALCLLAVCVFAFLSSAVLFRRPAGVKLLFAVLAVSGACITLWGVSRVLFGPGLPLTSTYTNRNRLAALLVMELFAAVGWAMLAMRRDGRWERTAAVSCAGAIALGIVMTLSRLGLASVAVSLVLLAFLAFRKRFPVLGNRGAALESFETPEGRPRRSVLLAGASITVSAVLASLLTSLDPVLARYSLLFEQGLGRLTCWRTSLGIVRDFPLVGTGAGSFRHVFPLYQRAGELEGFWKYAHNDVLNTLTDLGPAGLVLVGAAVFLWYRLAWGGFARSSVFRKTVAWIGVGAVTAVLVHSLADFVLKQPANALVFSVLAGAVAGTVGARSARPMPRPLFGALAAVSIAFAVLLVPVAKAGYWKARAEKVAEPDQRAEALTNALRHDPRDGETRHAAAQVLVATIPAGDAGAAREVAQDVVALLRGAPPGETVDARALYLAGAVLRQSGDAAGADIAMRTAAGFAGAYDDATFGVGVYFLRRWIETRGRLRLGDAGALDLSVEYLGRACLTSPGRLKWAFDLLSVHPESASRIREIVPPDPGSQLQVARHLRRAGRVPEARDVLELAVKDAQGADRRRVFELLANLRDETGDAEGALEARLRHVMETPVGSRPAAASAQVDRLLRAARAADAKLFVEALRRRFPAEPAGLYAQARYSARSGDHLLAYRALREYIKHSLDAEAFHRLADAARRNVRLPEAERYAGRAIEMRPREARYLLARAAIRTAAGETEGAVLDLRAVLHLNPGNARARRRLASVYLGAGRPLHAVEVWKEALQRTPEDASVHFELALAYRAAGLYEDAAVHARRAVGLATGLAARPETAPGRKRAAASVAGRARDLLRSMYPDDASH